MAEKKLSSFEPLFRAQFKPLCAFAVKYVPDQDEAKGIVHDVFVALWDKMDQLPDDTQYKSYLYTAVRNRCLNHLRDRKKIIPISASHESVLTVESNSVEVAELEREIAYAMATLPAGCREIFELSRHEGLKYAEIASRLGLSVKTVEAQMSKALSLLRAHLGEFLSLVIYLLMM